jgi:metal-responsive CopG/Arc/MetJ family transcriptional regulator
MSNISLRLPGELLKEADRKAKELKVPRAEYMRRAIEEMNKRLETERRRERIKKASFRVRGESMGVNAEFSRVERDVGD